MKTDAQLKAEVAAELEWDPAINPAHVGLAVADGVVTLSGHLETFAEKFTIEQAVQRVEGVRAVAIELDVRLSPQHQRSDTEIAQAVEASLRWHVLIPAERIHVRVEQGWVTLSGQLDWDYQRKAAQNAVQCLSGVVGLSNEIQLRPQVLPGNVSLRIRDALVRHAQREARHIDVSVAGSTAVLCGRVDTWAERAAAQGAAWSAPGIEQVVNHLVVGRGG